MWELNYKESWAPKNWYFWTVVLEKTPESPLDCKEIQPVCPKGNQSGRICFCKNNRYSASKYSLEELMWKLKSQYFGYLMRKTDSLEKTLMLGKNEGRRRRGWQRMRWLDGTTDSKDIVWASPGNWWWMEKPGMLQSTGLQSWTWLSDWIELNVTWDMKQGILLEKQI